MTGPVGPEVRVEEIHDLLRAHGATVATAESLTGGRLAAWLTATPGASETFRGGFVTYATALKHDLLGVPEAILADPGVVSADCAVAMATGAREAAGSTYAVSTTGVAGPGPAEGVPAGRVFVAVVGPAAHHVVGLDLSGGRDEIQDLACRYALSELAALLHREDWGLE
jgi:nicotinamide-nucleotide amidase